MFVEFHRKDNGNQVTINSNYVAYFITHYTKEQTKGGVRYSRLCDDPLTLSRYEEEYEDKFVPDGTEIYIHSSFNNGCTTMLLVSETYEEVAILLEQSCN